MVLSKERSYSGKQVIRSTLAMTERSHFAMIDDMRDSCCRHTSVGCNNIYIYIILILDKSVYILCATEIMAKDGNNNRGKEKKQCAQFITQANSSITHFHIIVCPSGSMILPGAEYYPVAQNEVKSQLRGLYPQFLTKLFKTQRSRTI